MFLFTNKSISIIANDIQYLYSVSLPIVNIFGINILFDV